MNRLSRVLYLTVTGLILASVSSVYAQEEGDNEFTLEEVQVTAERREANLQVTPISATVFSATAMENKGINNIQDIQLAAPSIAINTYNRSTYVNIRGVGLAQASPTSTPGIAFYIDGVYIPHEQLIAQSYYDISSIEVLRGPQGTLTGQNSTGGAIYMRTPAPELNTLSGYIDQTIGDYDWYRTIGAVNFPLGDKIAVRLAGTYNTQGSFTDNIGPSPSEPGSKDLLSGRIAVRFQPKDSMSFDIRYEKFDYETDYNAVKNRNDAVTDDPFTIEEDAISFLNQDGYRASMEAHIDLSRNIQMRILASKFDGNNYDQADGDRTATALPVPEELPASSSNRAIYPGRVSYTTQEWDIKTAEFNLLNTDEGPLQWIAGAFYLDENSPVAVFRDNYHTTDFVESNSDIITELDNKSWSGFGQVDYRLSEAFEVGVGLRYSKDEQDYTKIMLPGPPPEGGYPTTSSAESSETTGRVGIKYFMSPGSMLYLTASKGYKAGGVNLDDRVGNYDPENNKVYELGYKSTIADGRLRINGNLFYSDYEGFQLSALKDVDGVLLSATQNAASGEIYGLELELFGQFDAFGFNLGAGLINAEFAEDVYLTNSLTNADELVPAGRDLPFSPDMTITAGVQYDYMINSNLTITPRLQVAYMDKQYATPFPDETTLVPDRTVVDFRLMVYPGKNLRFEGFITNLFDEEYIAVQLQDASSAMGGYIYGPPRQIGVRAKYSF